MATKNIEYLRDRYGNRVFFKDKELRAQLEEFQETADNAVATAESAVATANETSEYVHNVEYSAATAATEAAASATAAAGSATNAALSAENASDYADSAQEYSNNAQNSAGTASSFSAEASAYAQNANTSRIEAASYSSSAQTAAQQAAQYATQANAYKEDAEEAASNAATFAGNAADSAAQTSQYVIAAATSANNAADSAGNASTSETNAASSASAAAESASDAADSADAAAAAAAQFNPGALLSRNETGTTASGNLIRGQVIIFDGTVCVCKEDISAGQTLAIGTNLDDIYYISNYVYASTVQEIGYVEGRTSTHSYEIGDYFVQYNHLCKAIKPIAVGDYTYNGVNYEYVTVSNELTNINETIDTNNALAVYDEIEVTWTQGTINSNTGEDSSSSIAIRTDYIENSGCIRMTLPTVEAAGNAKYNGQCYLYDANHNYLGKYDKSTYTSDNSRFYTGFTVNSDAAYLRFVLGGTTVQPGTTDVKIYNVHYTDSTLTKPEKAADAKAVGDEITEINDEITGISNEITELKNDLSGIGSSALPSKSASGSVVTFSDGADGAAVKSLVLNLEPAQSGSGDPSPSNIRPISGYDAVNVVRCGVNIWDGEWENGTVNLTTGANVNSTGQIRTKNYVPVAPNTTYYYVFPTGTMWMVFFDANKNIIETPTVTGSNGHSGNGVSKSASGTITTPSSARYTRFYMTATYGATYNSDIAINYPSTTSDYETPSVTTYPISLSSAGTVYGGTLDVTSGVLTVDRVGMRLTSTNQTWSSGGTSGASTYRFYCTLNPAADTSAKEIMCSHATYLNGNTGDWGTYNMYQGIFTLKNANNSNPDITTLNDFKTWLDSQEFQICYPLATPITYQLTPTEVTTLLGYNNIWMDAEGTIDLTYRVDTQMYVDDRVKATQGIIAPVEDSYTASTNYAIGDYVIVDDTLYKVTAAIASGGMITPNTNCTATTVMAQIKALA